MAPFRRIRPSNRQISNLPGIFIGILIGCSLMYILMIPIRTNETAGADGIIQPRTDSLNTERKGWREIYVFYGKENGLEIPPDKKWFSQVHQDEIVVDILGTKGYFIDLAANDAKELTNTLGLEIAGWDGLCIEPNSMYWYGLSHRKCKVIGAMVGGRIEQVDVKLRGVYGGVAGLIQNKLADFKKEPDAPIEKRYTAPLLEVLEVFNVPKTIDYLSLDVEGAEFLIMQNFPFDKYTVRLMTVERPKKRLRSLLEKNGYVFLKDLAWWGETLWAHKTTGLSPEHPKIAKIVTVSQD